MADVVASTQFISRHHMRDLARDILIVKGTHMPLQGTQVPQLLAIMTISTRYVKDVGQDEKEGLPNNLELGQRPQLCAKLCSPGCLKQIRFVT